jgi:hypothetical protein
MHEWIPENLVEFRGSKLGKLGLGAILVVLYCDVIPRKEAPNTVDKGISIRLRSLVLSMIRFAICVQIEISKCDTAATVSKVIVTADSPKWHSGVDPSLG